MSRSKKKPYYTDQNSGKPGRSKEAKRIAAKAVRNAGKKQLRNQPTILLMVRPTEKNRVLGTSEIGLFTPQKTKKHIESS